MLGEMLAGVNCCLLIAMIPFHTSVTVCYPRTYQRDLIHLIRFHGIRRIRDKP